MTARFCYVMCSCCWRKLYIFMPCSQWLIWCGFIFIAVSLFLCSIYVYFLPLYFLSHSTGHSALNLLSKHLLALIYASTSRHCLSIGIDFVWTVLPHRPIDSNTTVENIKYLFMVLFWHNVHNMHSMLVIRVSDLSVVILSYS